MCDIQVLQTTYSESHANRSKNNEHTYTLIFN